MKRVLLLLVLLLSPSFLLSQTFFNVDFNGTFPPTGWTIDAHSTNWTANASSNSGGTAPEARFNYSPTFTGDSRLISSAINTSGQTTITLEFKYNLDHYGGPYTIGVATRSGGGSWNVVWSIVNPTGSVPATTEIVTINNGDVGAADFQICWYFSGYSYNLNYWYLDDLKLFVPLAHDVMVKNINVDPTYVPGSNFTPSATLKNFGLNTETFDATCELIIGGSTVYTQNCSPITLTAGEEQEVTFPDYVLGAANDLYEIIVTTNLSGDMDQTNDSKTEWFNTYTTERNMVVLEIGTGTWCQYCPGSQLGADDLIANGHSVVVIENHNGDTYTNSYSDARNNYYGITGFPTAVFDGVESFVGGDHTQSMYQYYLPIFEARDALMSAFSVEVFGDHSNLDYNVVVRLNKLATIPPNWNNLVVHLTLTETGIPFSWQGQSEVDYCQRLFVPNENGTTIDLISNTTIDVPLSFTMDASWVYENCELGAFIQNLDTKEILQGSKVMLSELAPLPVELTSFTAEANSNGILLKWATASEINNLGFEVERSDDGINFRRIGFVQGSGTTTETKNYSYLDEVNHNNASTYYYRLKQMDYNGTYSMSEIINANYDVPDQFTLLQNYPNPFNPVTTIKYAVPIESPVSIKVYDLTGSEVMTLVNEVKQPGTYDLKFDASNLASGIYIYRMTTGSFNSVKKMTVLK
jgi:Secretion system C-terminal sorting domain